MREEKPLQLEEIQSVSKDSKLIPSKVEGTPLSRRENKQKILGGILGFFVFVGVILGTYKLSQKQIPSTSSTSNTERVYCQNPRPEVCTMECVQNPPYICGSDGKFYCNKCSACANPKVEWYIFQNTPCSKE